MKICSRIAVLVTLVILFFPCWVHAGGGPENVVVVVNADSDSSKLIANWYVHDRKIPLQNVIYLEGIPNRERVGEDVFKDKILKPILEQLGKRKLVRSVDYIVYSSDFPTTVDTPKLRKKLLEMLKQQPGQQIPDKVFGARCSLNAMTFFAGAVAQDNPGFMSLEANNYYRKPAAVLLRAPFSGEKQLKFQDAIKKIDSKEPSELDAAIVTLMEMAKANPRQLAVSYWLAKFYAVKGDAAKSASWLSRSVQQGWIFKKHTESDLAFDSVKSDPGFAKVIQAISNEPFDFVPTHGFKNQYAFAGNGMINAEPSQGNRHFLSCVLAVTRNYGSTEKDALASLRRTVQADETKPKGTFYFSKIGGVRSTTRSPNFAPAMAALERLGQTAVESKQIFPKNVEDIVGATLGYARLGLWQI